MSLAAYKPKELMLVLDRVCPLVSRFKVLASLALTLAACGVAAAQTAPTLLPYTTKLIAGGGTVAKFTAGALCPSSGRTALDTYGDGCLATELLLTGPRYAVADVAGNVFFSDYANGLIRRVDTVSGVVNLVAGSVYTSPAQGSVCGTGYTTTSTDAKGDGCLGVQVNIYNPIGLVFSPAGDLYFSESGNSDVRKIAATAGLIPASTVGGSTVYTGVITLVDGSSSLKTYGYASDNASTNIIAATQSFLDSPYGLGFDNNGHLFLAEEYRNAVLVVNTNAAGTDTVNGVSILAGTVAKIVGASTSGGSTCPNGSASTNKCNFGSYVSGTTANSQETDSPFAVTVDPSGNAYFANAYTRTVGAVSSAGTLTNYAGILNTTGKVLTRGAGGSFAIGTAYSVAADTSNDLYLTDPINGVVWRVDGSSTHPMYVVAGGASTVCSSAKDTYGDGCPATQATFGATNSPSSPTTATGVYGVSVDSHSDLFLGDTATNLVREIASGTQFGQVGGSTVTQTVDIHFAPGDSPAGSAYRLTTGSAFFTLGTPTCTSNSDTTVDCLLPITATSAAAATLGAFTGTLQVTSTQGGVGTFGLNGTFVTYPATRTTVAITAPSSAASCTAAVTYAVPSTLTLTATIVSTGSPGGSVTFYANGISIGQATVTNSMASLPYTFTTAGSYVITAVYSGDSFFTTSTGQAGSAVGISTPSFTTSLLTAPTGSSVVQGQTATYSFTLAQTVYTGTVTFSVSGMPANSSVVFSPASITAAGCTTSNTVAMSVVTQLSPVKQAGIATGGASGKWRLGLTLLGLMMTAMFTVNRRRLRGPWSHISLVLALLIASSGLMACGKGTQGAPSTPTGTYTLTVTATGSTGTTSSFTTPLTVTAYQDPYH